MLAQPLRPAGVGQALVENNLHQGEFGLAIVQPGAADHIAHHIHIGLERGLLGAKAFDQINAQSAQLIAHGRVNTRIATGYGVPRLARQSGQTTHEGATNAKNVYMHRGIVSAGWLAPV